MADYNQTKTASFNVASKYFDSFHKNLDKFDSEFFKGDTDSMAHTAEVIYWSIRPKLDIKEREKVEKMFNALYQIPKVKANRQKIFFKLKELRWYLGDCAEEHNMLSPNQKDTKNLFRNY